jgi:hypothetical protein
LGEALQYGFWLALSLADHFPKATLMEAVGGLGFLLRLLTFYEDIGYRPEEMDQFPDVCVRLMDFVIVLFRFFSDSRSVSYVVFAS